MPLKSEAQKIKGSNNRYIHTYTQPIFHFGLYPYLPGKAVRPPKVYKKASGELEAYAGCCSWCLTNSVKELPAETHTIAVSGNLHVHRNQH